MLSSTPAPHAKRVGTGSFGFRHLPPTMTFAAPRQVQSAQRTAHHDDGSAAGSELPPHKTLALLQQVGSLCPRPLSWLDNEE